MAGPLTIDAVDAQEARFAEAFAAGDISLARDLYDPGVVYLSPTTRLFGWPSRIVGIEQTLEFVQLTISGCRRIGYRLDERAVLPDGRSAYTRIVFDWDDDRSGRLRSVYVVLYRYGASGTDGGIVQQELYYDPGAAPERL